LRELESEAASLHLQVINTIGCGERGQIPKNLQIESGECKRGGIVVNKWAKARHEIDQGHSIHHYNGRRLSKLPSKSFDDSIEKVKLFEMGALAPNRAPRQCRLSHI
jgi:hypothetical protein